MKLQLTKSERNQIYKDALETYQSTMHLGLGMCNTLTVSLMQFYQKTGTYYHANMINPYTKKGMKQFPEIWKHKPDDIEHENNHWFPKNRNQKRINILKQAIKETRE